MNQPTEDRIKRIEEEQKYLRKEQEEIKKRIEQKTEPIPVTRIEVASSDVLEQLKSIDRKLDRIDKKQDEHATGLISHSRGISMLQTEMQGVKADTIAIRESQADIRDRVVEMQGVKADTIAIRESQADIRDRVVEINGTMTTIATKDDIARLENLIKQLLPPMLGEGQA